MIKLAVTQGPDSGKSFTVGEDPVFIGRLNAPVLLSDHKVSRHHAQIAREGDGYTVRDVGSSNGTFVNGARIMGSMPLHDGDKIQLGQTLLTVALAGLPAAAPARDAGGPLGEDDIVSMLAGPAGDDDEELAAAAIQSEAAAKSDENDDDEDEDDFAETPPPAGRPMRSAIDLPTPQPMRSAARRGASPAGSGARAGSAPKPSPKPIPLAEEIEDPLADTDEV